MAVSPWLEENAKNSFLLSKFQTTTILNGGNEKFFRRIDGDFSNLRDEFGIPKNNKIILFVCPRLNDPIKGYQFIPKLRNNIGDAYSIVVVGKITHDITLFNGIIYTNEIRDKNKLASIYNMADITLVLSERETFCMPIVESLLCGTGVISFKCFGPDHAFKRNEVIFIDYGDLNQLIQQIKINTYNVIDNKTNHTSKFMCEKYFILY